MNTWSTQNQQGGGRLKTKRTQLCGRQSEHYGTGYQLFEVKQNVTASCALWRRDWGIRRYVGSKVQ